MNIMFRLTTKTAFVNSNGLLPKEDGVHFNAESARELGRRYARAMQQLER